MPSAVFTRIAVLNRGECALRFMRAVREYNLEKELDIKGVALVTTPDEGAPFARLAHELITIGPAFINRPDGSQVSAYCDHDFVIKVLKDAKCDALWPGWGFLAEDHTFVQRLEAEGIVFLGPSSEAMQGLGDKIEAKVLAASVDVPLAPWTVVTPGADDASLFELGRKVGYPLMVKASAGGGGRGIRKVTAESQLLNAIHEVETEVAKIFGAGGLLLEACVENARHIEVQLVVGANGKARAVGIRDCSVQRRHQKVVEESPSPVVSQEVADMLCRASERLAEAADYRGVGTAEYLFQPESGECCFLEVNSRLQVEHTVTEMVYGCDLVKAQIDIARGEAWDEPSETPRGHAIEVRVNAEDPENGFQPRPGTVRVFRTPSGPGIRVDGGVTDGMKIAPEFDSMIAKVIAWAPTRRQAIARLRRALEEFEVVVEDGATNKAFLSELLAHDEVVSGRATTDWLDGAMEVGSLSPATREFEAVVSAAILEYRRGRNQERQRFLGEVQDGIPQHVRQPEAVEVALRLRGQETDVLVAGLSYNKYWVKVSDRSFLVTWDSTGEHAAFLSTNGERLKVLFSYGETGINVEVAGTSHTLEPAAGGTVKAPAPAVVVSVHAVEGERVEVGERLLTLEAMKMEMAVNAQTAGVVKAVLCRANQQVIAGQPLVVMEPDTVGVAVETTTLTVPDSPNVLEALFATNGDLHLSVIDDAEDGEWEATISDMSLVVRALMLGLDVPVSLSARLMGLLQSDGLFTTLQHPRRWKSLADALTIFVDTEELFDRNVAVDLGGVTKAMDQVFFAYCRRYLEGEDALAGPIKGQIVHSTGSLRGVVVGKR